MDNYDFLFRTFIVFVAVYFMISAIMGQIEEWWGEFRDFAQKMIELLWELYEETFEDKDEEEGDDEEQFRN